MNATRACDSKADSESDSGLGGAAPPRAWPSWRALRVGWGVRVFWTCCGTRDSWLAVTSDVRGPALEIACDPCGRRGRYSVAKLMAEHGDAKLTDLLLTLAACPKARSASIHDRCKAVYGQRLP